VGLELASEEQRGHDAVDGDSLTPAVQHEHIHAKTTKDGLRVRELDMFAEDEEKGRVPRGVLTAALETSTSATRDGLREAS